METFLFVLLLILKILGIILLVLLGLIVLILCLVLFVPVRYRGDGYYRDGEYGFKAKATYLLHIVTVYYDINDEESLIIKIFGIKYKKKEDKPEKKEKKDEAEITPVSPEPETETAELTEKPPQETQPEETVSETEGEPESQEYSEPEEETSKEDGKKRKKKKKKKKKGSKDESFYDKIKGYIETAKSEEFKETVVVLKREIIILLKAILPKKWKADGHVGFEDPYTNGQVCAAMGALYPVLYKHSTVYCNFENPGIDITGWFKGRIFGITLLVVGLRLFLNKSVRKTFDL